MHAIVAVDENWGIGYNDQLLYTIKEDQQYFRNFTLNKIVVIGDVSLKTLPGGNPLKDRITIVLSKDENLKIKNAIICNSVEQVLEEADNYNPDDVIIIGGQSVYEQFLDYCATVHVTRIKGSKPADKFFPNLDFKENWSIESISEEKTCEDLKFAFYVYRNSAIREPNREATAD